MPDKVMQVYENIIAAVISSIAAGLFLINVKTNKEFKVNVYKKIDDSARHVEKNYTTKKEFNLVMEMLKNIQKDVREIRDKL